MYRTLRITVMISKTDKSVIGRTCDWADGVYRPGCDKCNNKRNAVIIEIIFSIV